ncbi:hypothetical protein OWR29_25900 [Actinoplanes sp. Pm04-4]|uniref:Uncharacterized protein n=1 Tax=Paractinoplanes pyxinae TaxID=2997416 RepID=A0ABT4B6H4_9ACTN|nr:hypothetical protein [Actinoplanes pyxinae]MCY1141445.1 hypothetical protein [Actinoplanes pyxinae]
MDQVASVVALPVPETMGHVTATAGVNVHLTPSESADSGPE